MAAGDNFMEAFFEQVVGSAANRLALLLYVAQFHRCSACNCTGISSRTTLKQSRNLPAEAMIRFEIYDNIYIPIFLIRSVLTNC